MSETGSSLYSERLLPSFWPATVILALIAMLAIAFGAAIGAAFGWALFAALLVITGTAVIMGAPVIRVDERGLHAGPALLPWSGIGTATALDREQARAARGVDAVASRFTVLRTWHAPTAVLVEVNDEQDPHPAWLLTSRHPLRLTEALSARPTPRVDS